MYRIFMVGFKVIQSYMLKINDLILLSSSMDGSLYSCKLLLTRYRSMYLGS